MIGQNVRLVRLLGQGGMGSVWVGEHLTLHIEVAVKFMAAEIAKDPPAVARFTREATAAAQIKSPHVVQTFDHGVTPDGFPYIVMELLEGEDLSKRLEREGPLAPSDVAVIVSQVCKALSRAHAAGIVHRDIKPDNIFLSDQDGELFIKVLDFGIAKKTQEVGFGMTSTGTMVGTPYYMSPEQVLSAKDVDRRSDLWSLGVVAYHALTARVPFHAETLGGLCVAIERGVFTPPSQLNPAVSPAFDAWFTRALARDPTQRFQLAKEMADALQPVARTSAAFGVSTVATRSSARLMRPALSESGETRPSDSGVAKPGDSGRPSRPSDGSALRQSDSAALRPPGVPGPGSVPVRTLLDATVTGRKRPSRGLLVLGLAGGGVLGLIVLVIAFAASGKRAGETAASAAPAASPPPRVQIAPVPAAASVAPVVELVKPVEPQPSASVASEPEPTPRAEPSHAAEKAAPRSAPRRFTPRTRAAKSEPTQSAPTSTTKDRGF